jgi:hypothetical protein
MKSYAKNYAVLNILILACAAWLLPSPLLAQVDFEQEPISYEQTPTNEAIVELQKKLDAGQTKLEFTPEHGFLRSVLKELDINPSSQVLVHSKTSFQLRKISPSRPRALYYNDTSYVGWVQGGDVLEIMSIDPQQGQVFYTLTQEDDARPKFIHDRGQCITCHASSRTQNVPGALVRSVFVDASGQPQFGSGTFTIDHRSPFEQRWGGWYVTGTHGKMRHMGNVVSEDRQNPERVDREAGANVTDLSEKLNVTPYLSPHSDIVALMVIEHQTQMQNYLTNANYDARSATHYDGVMNAALERPMDHISDTTKRRIASAGDKVLQYMLFCKEFTLESPVEGTSTFTKDFQARGPRDSQGRSLRDFDLQTRMFKYPCSYLIYSPTFDGLPAASKEYITTRLHDILTGKDKSPEFAHLTPEDRRAILEILTETKPDLWN